jgi:hypothetical protein
MIHIALILSGAFQAPLGAREQSESPILGRTTSQFKVDCGPAGLLFGFEL